MTEAKKSFSRTGFALLIGMLVVLVISLLLKPLVTQEALEKFSDSMGPSALLLLTYAPNFVILLVFWLIIRTLPKVEWKKESLGFGRILKIFVMMYAISSILNQIGAAVSGVAPAGGTEQLDLINKVVNTRLLIGFMIPSVIGPIVEELIFRKLMIDRLHNYGETTVIVFTSLCFGLFHGNLTQFLYATTVGVFLGYVYCKTGKVVLTMIMHMLLNTLSSSIMLLLPVLSGGSEDASVLAMLAIGVLLVLVVVMTVAGFILIIRHLRKKDFVLDNSMPEAVAKSDVLKTVYLNPGVVLLFAYTVWGVISDLFKLSLPF